MWQLISDIRLTAQKMIGFNCPSFEQFVVSPKGDAVCSSVIMSIIVGKKCQAPVGSVCLSAMSISLFMALLFVHFIAIF